MEEAKKMEKNRNGRKVLQIQKRAHEEERKIKEIITISYNKKNNTEKLHCEWMVMGKRITGRTNCIHIKLKVFTFYAFLLLTMDYRLHRGEKCNNWSMR